MAGQFTPTLLEVLLAVVLVLLATVVSTGWARARAAADVAVARAQRDALTQRVDDLAAQDAERQSTAALLAPVQQALGRMETHVSLLERDRMEQFGVLGERLAEVSASTATLGTQTSSLAGALNASQVRGSWGEVQLRRILEHAGMLARCDFDEQVSAVTAHGARVRPDVVVRLPGDRVLVIDAKAPMSAFLSAQRPDRSPEAREDDLRAHAAALRTHIEALSAKAYWSAFTQTPQLVVCFIPSDAVLATALLTDPALYDEALSHRVVLASPASLLALLRTVAFTWQQDTVATDARHVLDMAQELYARLATTGTTLTRMGASLRRTVEAYNALVGTLESRVLVTARRMHDLGLADPPVPEVPSVVTAPRPLSAAELLETAAGVNPAGDVSAPTRRDRSA